MSQQWQMSSHASALVLSLLIETGDMPGANGGELPTEDTTDNWEGE